MADIIQKGLESLRNIKKEKREYKEYLERVKALPAEYGFAYEKMTEYMWSFYRGGDGYDMVAIQGSLLELFEAGVSENKGVSEVTGGDAATICDSLLHGIDVSTETPHDRLNRELRERLV